MKHTILLAGLSLAAVLPVRGQVSGNCGQPLEAPMSPGSHLVLELRPGNVEVAGTNSSVVRVICDKNNYGASRAVGISLAAGHLRVFGGPDHLKHFNYRIEIPARTDVVIRCTAGDLNVSGLEGDKDITLNAGNLTVLVGKPESYRTVETSMLAGNLRAPAFGVTKEGLFHDFHKENRNGQYHLKAKVLAGDLTLK